MGWALRLPAQATSNSVRDLDELALSHPNGSRWKADGNSSKECNWQQTRWEVVPCLPQLLRAWPLL